MRNLSKIGTDSETTKRNGARLSNNIGVQMKKLLLSLLIFCAIPAMAQDPMLGKSCDEILAMGHEKWSEYWATKRGASEADMDQAAVVYADCLKKSNEAELPKLQAPDRDRLLGYKKLYSDFRVKVMEQQMTRAGGGTMYTHGSIRGAVADEELMQSLIALCKKPIQFGTAAKKEKMMDLIGDVRKGLAIIGRVSEADKKTFKAIGVDPKKILTQSKYLFMNYDTILPGLPRQRQEECMLVLEFYMTWIRFDGTVK